MTTKVMFLKDPIGKFKGIVYAVFPEEIADPFGNVLIYNKIGQHGSGNLKLMLEQSTLAGINEYFPLFRELRDIGHNDLDIIYQI